MRPGRRVAAATEAGPAPEQITFAVGLRVDPLVSPPIPLMPPDGMIMDTYSEQTLVTLQPVPGAVGYQLEFVAADGSSTGYTSTTPEIEISRMGDGKWRVWAILPDGLRSAASQWRSLTYRAG